MNNKKYYIENYNTGYPVTEKYYTKYFKTLNQANNFLSNNFYNSKNYNDFYIVCESFNDGVTKKIPIEY